MSKTKTQQHDYSEFQDAPGHNVLAVISSLALEQKKAEAEVERCEEALKKAQKVLADIAEFKLPQMMDEARMEEFTTKDGIKIAVKENIRASIPEALQPQAFAWLKKMGHDNLIKRVFAIEFSKDEEKWAEEFEADLAEREQPLKYEIKRGVHAQTLASFVKEQLEEGINIPMNLFGAYRQRKTKITVKNKAGVSGDTEGSSPF